MSWTVKDRKLKKKTKRKSNYSKLGHAYSNMVELLEKKYRRKYDFVVAEFIRGTF